MSTPADNPGPDDPEPGGFEPADSGQVDSNHGGSEQPAASGDALGGFDEHDDATLDAAALQQLLLSTDTVQAFLDQLVQRAAADTRHHCGITVGPPEAQDDAFTVASSDGLTRQLDELQYSGGDGPCLEALRTSVPVIVTDMDRETRWPYYVQRAAALGARSSLSYPLLNGDASIGALNFYAFEALEPGVGLQARAGELAAVAAGALALALRLGQRDDMIAHLRTSLTSRSTIDQAIGILMAQQRCTARAAFDLLRKASQSRNIKLRDVAAGIVGSIERGSPGAASRRY
jgi:GAF domain-containing protein